ncbi:spore gernimation protein GerC [Priestia megaterium]|uniref:Ger(x)C family spore germination protein n=1 Tax=Priestia megaterium TaxID=1404 RepID=UPI000BFC4393|nr:Ger(x)C family spore germination protein [Priestia megaterium]PGN53195.1 spore gernimation protein GerC [Priestia megaterium]PGQ87602.1 spore gernimation protein GerC [Priestia megaterium]
MKGKQIVFIIAIIVSMLTGCWSRTEVNDVAIVLGVALDRGENGKTRLALQIAIPKALGSAGSAGQSSGGPKSTMMVSAEGETVMEAYRIIQGKLPREVFFAHSRVIIVGQKLARDGVSPILDFFSRHRQAHLRSYLLFTKGNAIDLLKANPQLESVIAEQIREQEKTGVGLQVRVREFLKRMLTEGEEPAAAQISPLPLEATRENETGGSTASQSTPSLNGAAVFQGDQLTGWLNEKEMRGVLWIRNELESGILTVTIPTEKDAGKVGAQILKGSTHIKPIFHKDKVKVRIDTYGEVEIFENTSTLDLSDPKAINTLQSVLEKDVKKRIQSTLDKTQKKLKSDIFGFGQAVYRTNPKRWENTYKKRWSEIFPNLEVEINSHITVSSTGFSTKSMSLPETKR